MLLALSDIETSGLPFTVGLPFGMVKEIKSDARATNSIQIRSYRLLVIGDVRAESASGPNLAFCSNSISCSHHSCAVDWCRVVDESWFRREFLE